MIYNMAHKNSNMTAKKNNKIQIYEKKSQFSPLIVFVCFVICYFWLILKLSMEWRGSLDQYKR